MELSFDRVLSALHRGGSIAAWYLCGRLIYSHAFARCHLQKKGAAVDTAERNYTHENERLVETIKKEERQQKLYTTFSVNPNTFKPITGKPNVGRSSTRHLLRLLLLLLLLLLSSFGSNQSPASQPFGRSFTRPLLLLFSRRALSSRLPSLLHMLVLAIHSLGYVFVRCQKSTGATRV